MFHRRFGEVKISPSSIRRIYLRHKIRFKNIKRGKREIDFTEPHYQSLFYRMRAILEQMQESKTKGDLPRRDRFHLQHIQVQGLGPQPREGSHQRF